MAVASQYVLHRDDSVEVRYLDGSRLQLTPCGSVFVHHQPPGQEQHPLHGVRTVQQRTRFATSEFRDKVAQALEFRNKFAECPYICKDLTQPADIVILHTNVSSVKWPVCEKHRNVTSTPSGGVCVNSLDGHAALILSPCRQQITVKYLAGFSQPTKKIKSHILKAERPHSKHSSPCSDNASVIQNDGFERKLSENCIKRMQDCSLDGSYRETILADDIEHHHVGINRTSTPNHIQESLTWNLSSVNGQNQSEQTKENADNTDIEIDQNNTRWEYIWLVKFLSIEECHDIWKHPLCIALEFAKFYDNQKNTSDTVVDGDHSYRNEDSKHASAKNSEEEFLLVTLPKSLSQNCAGSYLHRFKDEVELNFPEDAPTTHQKKVKVLFTHGVVYWLLWRSSPHGIHIFPGDGSVLRSHGPAGNFFKHTFIKDGKRDERVHSVKCPPPKLPGSAYSISNLIKTGSGLLYTMLQDTVQLNKNNSMVCWKVEQESSVRPAVATILLEESVVAGMGKFSAYSNGHVRVVYEDRTCLDMVCDFSKRVHSCMQHSQDEASSQHDHCARNEIPRVVIDGVTDDQCRLLLPSAQYVIVSLSNPQQYARYIQAAKEWAGWVNCSPSERYLYYKDTIYDSEKQRSINVELKKISCFNYIVENTVLSNTQGTGFESGNADVSQFQSTHDTTQENQGAMSLDDVKRALLKTASAINDIDKLLKPK